MIFGKRLSTDRECIQARNHFYLPLNFKYSQYISYLLWRYAW